MGRHRRDRLSSGGLLLALTVIALALYALARAATTRRRAHRTHSLLGRGIKARTRQKSGFSPKPSDLALVILYEGRARKRMTEAMSVQSSSSP